MLKARIVTAIVLVVAFLCALFFLPPIGWLGVTTLIAAAAFWEWGGLMKAAAPFRGAMAAASIVFIAAAALLFPSAIGLADGLPHDAWRVGRWFYLPAAVFWLCVVPFWLKRHWGVRNLLSGSLTGMVVILPAWLALIQLRQLGSWQLLAVMAIVWIADSAAYFFGRALGRHKLAPNISPGKTWEGAMGGVLAVVLSGLAFSSRLPEVVVGNYVLLVTVLVLLAAISIVGDLFESLLKRQAGLKDSSNLLPGHGGVLDRIDSLTSTLPLVALLRFGMGI